MSFIPVGPESDFPIQNLPYGIFSTLTNVSLNFDLTKHHIIYYRRIRIPRRIGDENMYWISENSYTSLLVEARLKLSQPDSSYPSWNQLEVSTCVWSRESGWEWPSEKKFWTCPLSKITSWGLSCPSTRMSSPRFTRRHIWFAGMIQSGYVFYSISLTQPARASTFVLLDLSNLVCQ